MNYTFKKDCESIWKIIFLKLNQFYKLKTEQTEKISNTLKNLNKINFIRPKIVY